LSTSDEAAGVQYNVYAVPAAGSLPIGVPLAAPVPLNPKPLDETTYTHEGAAPGKEQCFVVRSVATVGRAAIESDPSDPICLTPRDIFPPAAPKNLQAVGSAGVINLIWDANTESDLAGYLVLRGEAPGDTLQPLTGEPIKETRYQDRSIKPGVSYVYAIVAVDRATNRSAASNRVLETAR
jgi:fibronectin type 3 domain-containing protein